MARRDVGRRLTRLMFLAAGGVEVAPVARPASDAAEDGRVERDDDQHGRYDGADDHKRHVEDDVDVCPVGQDVAVRQPTARRSVSVIHDADGERREASEDGAGDGLGEYDSTSVRDRDDE